MREIYRIGNYSPTGQNNIEQERDFINRFLQTNYGVCLSNAVTGSLMNEIACIQEARRQPKVITTRDVEMLKMKFQNTNEAYTYDSLKARVIDTQTFLQKIGILD